MSNQKFFNVLESVVILSILFSFLVIFSISFSGLKGITGYAAYVPGVNDVSKDFAAASINVTNCSNINTPGVYELQSSIIDSSTSYCINIQVNNVILDCLGNKIDGDGTANYGIYISRPAPDNTNITVKNCIITDWGNGIYVRYGLNNLIYNNLFNNTNNVILVPGSNQNNWNTSKTSGVNIMGGPYLGGNYWANASGTGFSETCVDASPLDGICDLQYNLTNNNNNNTDYLPLFKDLHPSVDLVNPLNGTTKLTTDSVNFVCNATDDRGLKNISLYIWDSVNSIFYNNTKNMSGLSNSSSWSVSGFSSGYYKWNCLAFDILEQSSFGAINYSLKINQPVIPPSGGGGGDGKETITENVTEENVTEEISEEVIEEPGIYETSSSGLFEINYSLEIVVDITNVSTGVEPEGNIGLNFTNTGDRSIGNISVEIYEQEDNKTNGLILGGANSKSFKPINPITGLAIGNIVNLTVLEDTGKLDKETTQTRPLIIQKFVQYNIGPGIYISTSQVNQKPLKTEPIKKFIAPLLKPGETVSVKINIKSGLTVEDKELIMDFKSFGETFKTQKVTLKAIPPVFGFALGRAEENSTADVYVIISNINQEETDYYIGLDINRLPASEYKRELGIRGLFQSVFKGPKAVYYDYLGPYTLRTDESTLLTQRFIFDEVPIGNYMFDATLYRSHRPVSKISRDIQIKR